PPPLVRRPRNPFRHHRWAIHHPRTIATTATHHLVPMISARLKTFLAIALVTTVAIAPTADGAHAQLASANETARLLAGMQPPPDSPLLVLTRDRVWQEHANHFNSIFAKLKNHQLTRIPAWSRARLTSPSPVL